MKISSEYDQRQLKLMYESINFFEKKQMELSTLVANLEALLNVLEAKDADWEEIFLSELATLEEVNAYEIMKENGEETMIVDNEKLENLTKEAIVNIKNLLDTCEVSI